MEKKYLIGIDEVGRGPLAGPVAVAAVLFFPHFDTRHLKGIKDSKKLSPQKRELWLEKAITLKKDGYIDFSVSFSSEKVIDKKGIMHAIRLSLKRSVKKMCKSPYETYIYLDGGLTAPKMYPFQKTIIRGDELLSIIALASIIAKVGRDRKMEEYAEQFPEYGFEQHKGYGTDAHYKAIQKYGLCAIHRRSFLHTI
ncbi:MAG: ribonuclease HII [Parcubacteria group bacterium]|nr:ribonuclease HII [Parcubacteria group bacterium]